MRTACADRPSFFFAQGRNHTFELRASELHSLDRDATIRIEIAEQVNWGAPTDAAAMVGKLGTVISNSGNCAAYALPIISRGRPSRSSCLANSRKFASGVLCGVISRPLDVSHDLVERQPGRHGDEAGSRYSVDKSYP